MNSHHAHVLRFEPPWMQMHDPPPGIGKSRACVICVRIQKAEREHTAATGQ